MSSGSACLPLPRTPRGAQPHLCVGMTLSGQHHLGFPLRVCSVPVGPGQGSESFSQLYLFASPGRMSGLRGLQATLSGRPSPAAAQLWNRLLAEGAQSPECCSQLGLEAWGRAAADAGHWGPMSRGQVSWGGNSPLLGDSGRPVCLLRVPVYGQQWA